MKYIAKIECNGKSLDYYEDDCIVTIKDSDDINYKEILEYDVMDDIHFGGLSPYGLINEYNLVRIKAYDLYFLKYADSIVYKSFESYRDRDKYLHDTLHRDYIEIGDYEGILWDWEFVDNLNTILRGADFDSEFSTIAKLFIECSNIGLVTNKHKKYVILAKYYESPVAILIDFNVIPDNFVNKLHSLYNKD